MNKLLKLSLKLALISFFISWYRHFLWCKFEELGFFLAAVENSVVFFALLVAFGLYKLFSSVVEANTLHGRLLANLPLAAWLIYALYCNIIKILFLTSLMNY